MNKKGQLDHPIIGIFVLIIGLIIIAPFVMKLWVSIQSPLATSLGNTTGGIDGRDAVNKVFTVGINMWDYVIVFAFVVGIVLMFISAFFIDVHPIFIILYIIINFVFMLFGPDIIESLLIMYNPTSDAYLGDEVINNLTFTSWIANNFGVFIVGLMVITGIIIYTKISWNSGGRG